MYQDNSEDYRQDARGFRNGLRPSRFHILPIVLFALYGLYYYVSNQHSVPITGRSQMVDMARSEEIALGIQSYQEILQQERVIPAGRDVQLIREVGQKIAKAADVPDFEWEFNLIASNEANAFCLPGGKVVVNSGILGVAENPDGLAVVLGHEIAHALARHGAERMAQQQLLQLGQMALGMSMQDMDMQTRRSVMGVFGVGSQFGILLPFSRTHESEADHIGLILMARACFNPEEAPRFWDRMMSNANRNAPPQFLSTHPSPEHRIEQLEAWMEEAKAERAKYCSS